MPHGVQRASYAHPPGADPTWAARRSLVGAPRTCVPRSATGCAPKGRSQVGHFLPPACSLHFGLHTSFAHSTAYTPHTRHGFTHRDTESVPHTEQSPSGPSQPPPVANLSSLYPPRTHVKSILAPPARAAHTLLGAVPSRREATQNGAMCIYHVRAAAPRATEGCSL
jgi:hypothetical protein